MNKIEFGDCREIMKQWAEQGIKVQMCVTSPPYYGLRSYLDDDDPDKIYEVGLEQSPDEYINNMVEVFRGVWDILDDDGTLWVNIGDSYAAQRNGSYMPAQTVSGGVSGKGDEKSYRGMGNENTVKSHRNAKSIGLKHKDLIGIPWKLAFALQADGWYIRQDIIWQKLNPMPESVKDRCTKSHEYIFLLSKKDRYYYDNEAIKVPASEATLARNKHKFNGAFKGQFKGTPGEERYQEGRPIENPQFSADGKANKRSVWTVSTKPYKGAHFATFPPDLIEPCILAGTSEKGHCPECGKRWKRSAEDITIWSPQCTCGVEPVPDVVFDPFMGSGTTAATAINHGRNYLGCELNTDYAQLIDARIDSAINKNIQKPRRKK